MRIPLTLSAAGLLALPSIAQTRTGLNEKIFHNAAHTSATTRVSANAVDTIYFMQPGAFHTGYGMVSGWRGIFQDQNQATSEQVSIAVVKYAANGVSPDITPAGTVTGSKTTFTLFGSGTGAAAYSWTLTMLKPVTIPAKAGIALTLAAPRGWPNDGVSIHYQAGTTLKLPAGVSPARYTFYKTTTNTLGNFATAGSTLALGFLLERPILQVFTNSSAYGTAENLYGPESLFPGQSRGDKIGFRFEGDAFPSQFVILMLAKNILSKGITSPFGMILIDPLSVVSVPPIALDKKGKAVTPSFAIPAQTTLAAQSIFVDVKNLKLVTSDAQSFQAR